MNKIYLYILAIFCLLLIQCKNFSSENHSARDMVEPAHAKSGYFENEPKNGRSNRNKIDEDLDYTFTSADACSSLSGDLANVSADFTDNGITRTFTTQDVSGNSSSSAQSPPIVHPKDDPNLKLIKTGYLTFEVDSIERTRFLLESELKKLGGYISNEKQQSSRYRNTVTMTLRLPKYYFDDIIKLCDSQGVKKFDQREIKTVDVSEEFLDLTARIKTKKELEKRYHQLLKKAKDVEEVIKVEREIEKLRSEIESKEGRLKYLSDRVSLSTVHLEFYKELPKEEKQLVERPSKLNRAFLGGWNGLVTFFLGLIYIWPMLLFGGLVLFILKKYFKTYKTSKP